MISTIKRRKFLVTKFEVAGLERFRLVEIKLPAHVKKVTGILVTASWKFGSEP